MYLLTELLFLWFDDNDVVDMSSVTGLLGALRNIILGARQTRHAMTTVASLSCYPTTVGL